MPRLPTIRVIGSQAISTRSERPPAAVIASPRLLEAGRELRTLVPPRRLLVHRLGGEAAQGPDHRAVHAARGGRDPGAGRLVHERHELVREAGHGAGDADAAHVRAAARPVDPAPLGYVALDDRPPAAELDQALGGAVLAGELALLEIAGAAAALMHRDR